MKRMAMATAAVLLAALAAAAEPVASGWGREWDETMQTGERQLAAAEYARAQASFDRATKLAPAAATAWLRQAATCYHWGDAVLARRTDLWPLALQAADKARFLDPLSAEAAFLAAVIRYRMGDFKGAAGIYEQLEHVRQGDIDLYLDLAVAARKAGDLKLTVLALDKARALDPSARRLYAVAGEVLGGR